MENQLENVAKIDVKKFQVQYSDCFWRKRYITFSCSFQAYIYIYAQQQSYNTAKVKRPHPSSPSFRLKKYSRYRVVVYFRQLQQVTSRSPRVGI